MNEISFKSLYRNNTGKVLQFCRLDLNRILLNKENNLLPDEISSKCVNGLLTINVNDIVLPIKRVVYFIETYHNFNYDCTYFIYRGNISISDKKYFLGSFIKINKKDNKNNETI